MRGVLLKSVSWMAAMLLVWGVWSAAQAQPPVAPPPPLAPAPGSPYRPAVGYDSLMAGLDAYRRAEEGRQTAIGWQLQVQDDIRWINMWLPPRVPRPLLPDIYAAGSPRALAVGYGTGALPTYYPWPKVPGDIWGYPWYGSVAQPRGHERPWSTPWGYVYRPVYDPIPSPGLPPWNTVPPNGYAGGPPDMTYGADGAYGGYESEYGSPYGPPEEPCPPSEIPCPPNGGCPSPPCNGCDGVIVSPPTISCDPCGPAPPMLPGGEMIVPSPPSNGTIRPPAEKYPPTDGQPAPKPPAPPQLPQSPKTGPDGGTGGETSPLLTPEEKAPGAEPSPPPEPKPESKPQSKPTIERLLRGFKQPGKAI